MKRITIILPTYNEKRNIETLIPAILDEFKTIRDYELSILVVDDYSPDGTAEVVETLRKKHKNIHLISKQKEGLGAAYVFGMEYAVKNLKPNLLMQMDADWSHNPKLLPQFIKKIETGADFAVGSRYIPGGGIPKNWGLHRKLFSIVANIWVRVGLGINQPHDWSSGYRIMKTEVYKKVFHGLSAYSGYLFQIAFLHRVKKHGFVTAEVPLVFVDRVHGKSKIPAFEYILSVSLYVINNSKRIKYLVIGVIGFSVQTLISKLLILLGLFPGLSVTVGAFCAIVTNFIGNNFWTFNTHKIIGFQTLFKKFVHFLGTSVGAVIIQGVVVTAGVYVMGERAWFPLMVFAIVCLVIPYNYFIYNRFIWKTHTPQHV